MKTSDFNFLLPNELIAQHPAERREASRLLVLDKCTGEMQHKYFYDILEELHAGDVLVLNNTKVIPARLYGKKEETGQDVEVLLLKKSSIETDTWHCMVRPGRVLKPGAHITFANGLLRARVLEITREGRLVTFSYEGIFEDVLAQVGTMPLPPYIKEKLEDQSRYQTVYAKYDGSAAAPTAGLHFTHDILAALQKKCVIIENVLLHVGLGTFQPVKVDRIEEHHMHEEYFSISEDVAARINQAKDDGRRIVAVGTTSTRALESAACDGRVMAGDGHTDIFIYPGYHFQIIDALITNFHLPQSTLLMLVSALAGRERILNAYEEAVTQGYRFFSFGDAMFIR